MQMQQQQNSNRTIVVQPPPLSRDPIFAENHLGYVMTNRDTLRGYLTESLSIDGVFLDKFPVAEWVLALEVTLFYRPPNVPTEQYLKSQNLWIMHKLLMSLDNGRVRERMQSLLNPPPPPPNSNNNNNSGNYNKNVRNALYGILKEAEYKTVNQHNVATGNILEELICKLTQFQKNYYNSLLEEKTAQVHRRCQMIRWCSMLIVNGNLQWLQKCPFEELLGQFQTWLNNEDGMHF